MPWILRLRAAEDFSVLSTCTQNDLAVFVNHPVVSSGRYLVVIPTYIPVKIAASRMELILWKKKCWMEVQKEELHPWNSFPLLPVKQGFIVLVHFNQDEWLCGEKQNHSFDRTCCYATSQKPDFRASRGQKTTGLSPSISFLISWRTLCNASGSLVIIRYNRNLLHRHFSLKPKTAGPRVIYAANGSVISYALRDKSTRQVGRCLRHYYHDLLSLLVICAPPTSLLIEFKSEHIWFSITLPHGHLPWLMC